ncbi:MAG: amidohydrolase family protein [Devosia sp.]|nr:amidohydrolase family protein [Devosia sp.]
MIVDSHTHAWARWPYQPRVPDAPTRGSAEHLIYEMDLNGIDRAVIVSARIDDNPDNNEYGAAAVRRFPGRLHQFADVDCAWMPEHHTTGAVGRLAGIADRLPIDGFTHYVQPENDGWFLSGEGLAFFRLAAERGLIASIAASPAWAADIGKVADANPNLVILLHHMAGIRAADPRSTLSAVGALASRPNVYVKLSGFHYAADDGRGFDYPHPEGMWIAEGLYRSFGPKRLCWGSDFPALSRYMTYRQSLEIVRLHCHFLAAGDLDWILGRTLDGLLGAAASKRNTK